MAFRNVEIMHPAEIHVRNGQLTVLQDSGEVSIPLEDISSICCSGADIRLSTMAMAKIVNAGIIFLTIDEKYKPAGILTPVQSNSRQAQVLALQMQMPEERREELWRQLVRCKIANQAGCLRLLGLDGADDLEEIQKTMKDGDEDSAEASAARRYFYYYGPKLNRRLENPLNSRLNYGYAIIRNSIIRALYSTGLNPAIGLHHTNQYNAFNLADDLIEPFRPVTDLLALSFQSDNIRLDSSDKKRMASVMRLSVKMQNHKIRLDRALEAEVDSLLSALKDGRSLELPQILPLEVTEIE